jgi:hypothetical protein
MAPSRDPVAGASQAVAAQSEGPKGKGTGYMKFPYFYFIYVKLLCYFLILRESVDRRK